MKNVKTILVLCLAICMVICLGIFASACGDDKDKYTVTVLAPDGTAAKDLRIEFCSLDGSNLRCLSGSTDENGKVVFDIKEFSDTTHFVMHIPVIPNGYYFDANDDGNGGKYLYVKDGYSTTINLKKLETQMINVVLENTSSTQKVEPAIPIAGFYELHSTTPFTLSGEGYSLTEGYYSVTQYLEADATFYIGTKGNSRSFSCALTPLTQTGKDEYSAFSAAAQCAFIFNLNANDSVHFINPTTVNNNNGNILIIDGENFKTNVDLTLLNLGDKFTVSTANNQAGTTIVTFDAPPSSTDVTVGEESTFDVLLIENGSIISWVTEEIRINFNADKAGTYRVTVTSSYENDVIGIIKGEYLVGDVPRQLSPQNPTSGKSCTASFDIALTGSQSYDVSVALVSGTVIVDDNSFTQTNVDYTEVGSDKVTYTVLVEYVKEK